MDSSIKPTHIKLSLENLALADRVTVVKFSEIFGWDNVQNCKTDKRIGTLLTVVAPQNEYRQFTVKLPVGFDEILLLNNVVQFTGFEAHFFQNYQTGEYTLTTKADKVFLAK